MNTYSILIVDDDPLVRKLLKRISQDLHWMVEEAASGQEAIEKLHNAVFQIYVIDVKMPGPSGLELAKIILQKDPKAAILILTGYAEINQAVDAIKKGVFDYIQKDNIENEKLKRILQRAAEFHDNRITQIQAQHEREQSLKNTEKSNQEFQAILELSTDLIFIVNAKSGEFTDCNKTACDTLGYSRTELTSLRLNDIISDFQGVDWKPVFQLIRNQPKNVIEKQIICKSKQRFLADLTYAYVCLDTGEYLAVIARDITERKQAEKEIDNQRIKVESQSAILETIIESIDEGILMADLNGVITEVNSWFLDLAQTPKEFVMNQNIGKIIQLIIGCEISNLLNDYKSGIHKEKKCLYTDVSDSRFMLTTQPIYKQEEYQGVIINIVDVSDLISKQKYEEKEIQYHRDFLSNAAKDLRTPLEGIVAISAQLAETSLDASQQLLLEMIKEFARSLSNLLESCSIETK